MLGMLAKGNRKGVAAPRFKKTCQASVGSSQQLCQLDRQKLSWGRGSHV